MLPAGERKAHLTPSPHDIIVFPLYRSRAMNFDFPPKKGSGIRQLLPGTSPDSVSLMSAMLEYDPDNRLSASNALQHSYFEEPR